ncbi:hypothetical protein WwAna1353 [Wolbachia endosymbiont of Drosophila ananassae]|nr:hypothetical protein WwAna1353 [Wolbachia endosymbiont of Drosophila ananassae]
MKERQKHKNCFLLFLLVMLVVTLFFVSIIKFKGAA